MTEPQHHEEEMISLFSLGEMRMVGIEVPAHLQQEADDAMLVLPRSGAMELARRILSRWEVDPTEAEAFLAEISSDVLSDVLVIHQLIRILVTQNPPATYINAPNTSLGGRTSWEAIRQGESEAVRASLAHVVFNGGW